MIRGFVLILLACLPLVACVTQPDVEELSYKNVAERLISNPVLESKKYYPVQVSYSYVPSGQNISNYSHLVTVSKLNSSYFGKKFLKQSDLVKAWADSFKKDTTGSPKAGLRILAEKYGRNAYGEYVYLRGVQDLPQKKQNFAQILFKDSKKSYRVDSFWKNNAEFTPNEIKAFEAHVKGIENAPETNMTIGIDRYSNIAYIKE